MNWEKIVTKLLNTVIGFFYIFLWTPLIIVIVFSFSTHKYGSKWQNFTTKWYYKLIANETVQDALVRSLIIALITMVVATFIGTITAYGLFKFQFRGKQFLRTSILLPLVFPSVITGAALLVFFTRVLHIPLGYPSIIIAHIVFCSPLAVFIILGRMQRMDWTLEEASMDLGATRFRTFKRVTLPVLLPGIMASAMLIFPWSFDDFVITYFVAGVGSTTLPIYVYSQLRFGTSPVLNTIGTLFVVVTIIGFFAAHFFQKLDIRK
jgi:spermidine/putrescine transport system permease protein